MNLVRRRSGGGAVFQDLGNSIFTFISTPKPSFDKDRNTTIVLDALKSGFGIAATASGRNDITLSAPDNRKISGSAFKHSHSVSLHHGTLLLDVDMARLANYLNPNKAKLASKGVSSVVARVVNLKTVTPTITHESVSTALIDSFLKTYGASAGSVSVTELSPSTPALRNNAEHTKCVEDLKEWEWRYGKTPEFSHHLETRFDWGIMDVHLQVVKGVITGVKIFSDALYAPLIESLHATIGTGGVPYSVAGVRAAIAKTKTEMASAAPPAVPFCDDFEKWITAQIH